MAVTARSPFRDKVRIDRDSFARIVRERFNPAVAAERDPGQYWDAATAAPTVDPLFLLAMAWHESSGLSKGMATITKSWGNTRKPSFGPEPVAYVTDPQRGTFAKYGSYMDGMLSTKARLVEPTWYYHNRDIGEIFQGTAADREHVWAPAGDNNDPNGYLRAVLDYMTAAQTQDQGATSMPVPMPPMNTDHPSKFFWERTGRKRNRAIVWHITDGSNSLGWLTQTGGVSAHFLIQTDTIYKLVDPSDAAWTNGDLIQPNLANPIIAEWARAGRNPNEETITIEVEGKPVQRGGQGYSGREKELLVDLTAWLCDAYNITPDTYHILGHNEINGRDRPYCPGLSEGEWSDLLGRVAARVSAGGGGTVEPDHPTVPNSYHDVELDFWVVGPFWEVFKASDEPLVEFGRPRTPEYFDPGRGLNVQYFERARLERPPGGGTETVTRGLVGLELAQMLGVQGVR